MTYPVVLLLLVLYGLGFVHGWTYQQYRRNGGYKKYN